MPNPAAILSAVIERQVANLAIDNPRMHPEELAREQAACRAEIVADWAGYRSKRDAAAVFARFLAEAA